jgi:hypothetical protein
MSGSFAATRDEMEKAGRSHELCELSPVADIPTAARPCVTLRSTLGVGGLAVHLHSHRDATRITGIFGVSRKLRHASLVLWQPAQIFRR